MMQCWSLAPSDRPTFSEAANKMEQYLSAELGYLALDDATNSEDAYLSPESVQYTNVDGTGHIDLPPLPSTMQQHL